jgi:hypothetical protein
MACILSNYDLPMFKDNQFYICVDYLFRLHVQLVTCNISRVTVMVCFGLRVEGAVTCKETDHRLGRTDFSLGLDPNLFLCYQ